MNIDATALSEAAMPMIIVGGALIAVAITIRNTSHIRALLFCGLVTAAFGLTIILNSLLPLVAVGALFFTLWMLIAFRHVLKARADSIEKERT